jgi:hypothetical protein
MPGSEMSSGGGPVPRRSAFVQRAMFVSGWTTVMRMISRAMADRTMTRTRNRIPLSRQSRRHHLGQGLRHEGAERRCRGLDGSEAVEEGQTLLGLAELDEKPLEGLPIAARESGLRGLLQPFAQHGGAPLEVLEEALPLVTDLQVREATDDRERREPDGPDETRGNAQAAPRWPTAKARRSSR